MKTKKLINFNGVFLLLLCITLASCGRVYQDSYSHDEMRTLVAVGQASFTTDSIVVNNDSIYGVLPIAKIEEEGYYPGISTSLELRYFRVEY